MTKIKEASASFFIVFAAKFWYNKALIKRFNQ